jgi:UDP-N-acetyl-D-glucosamine dehydrogenase
MTSNNTSSEAVRRNLIGKLENRTSTIGVVGLGYVGLPLSLRFAEVGYRVVAMDIDPEKVRQLSRGESYIRHISPKQIEAALSAGLAPTSDYARARDCDALIICVPTPLTRHREPDLGFVVGTVESLLPHLRAGQVISLESTTYPGTTEEELRPRIESRGFKIGADFFLCFSPEREDPGNDKYVTRTIPKICGGCTTSCLEVGVSLYRQVVDRVVTVSSTRVAEMTKLLENIHRAVNIGLVNEMKIVCDRMGIDIHEVIQAAATKPFGFVPYWPGPGLGGHCIPIDPYYLTWKAREFGVHTKFIELAGEINHSMPAWVVGKVAEALNERGRSVKGSRCLVLGIAYKKNVDDMRESPSVEMIHQLIKAGATVDYSDPYVPVFPKMRNYQFDMKSVEPTASALASYDVVLVGTNHDAFNYEEIKSHARLVVDSRGVYLKPAPNIVKA